jgi:hypothetical protein
MSHEDERIEELEMALDATRDDRDAARALAEERAGEIAAMQAKLRTLIAGFWYVDSRHPYLSAGHYLRLTADERLAMEELARLERGEGDSDGSQ